MTTVRKKYPGLDIAKFACSLVILFYHFFSEHGPIPALFEDMLSLYAVCVALFMVISGFLLYDKLLLIRDKTERWKAVKKQVKRILQVYLIWSIPYLIFSISRWDFSNISIMFVLRKIRGWVFESTFYTIWFMPSLAIGTLISYFIVEKLPSWAVACAAIVAYAMGALYSTYSFLIKNYSFYEPIQTFIKVWLNGPRGQFLYGFPLVTLGYAIANRRKQWKPIPLAIMSIIMMGGLLAEALLLRRFAGHTGIDLCIMLVPAVFFITEFFIALPIPYSENCRWLRKMSTLIFMSQRIFLTVIPGMFLTINILYKNTLAALLIVCGGTILFSATVVLLSKKHKILRLLY